MRWFLPLSCPQGGCNPESWDSGPGLLDEPQAPTPPSQMEVEFVLVPKCLSGLVMDPK